MTVRPPSRHRVTSSNRSRSRVQRVHRVGGSGASTPSASGGGTRYAGRVMTFCRCVAARRVVPEDTIPAEKVCSRWHGPTQHISARLGRAGGRQRRGRSSVMSGSTRREVPIAKVRHARETSNVRARIGTCGSTPTLPRPTTLDERSSGSALPRRACPGHQVVRGGRGPHSRPCCRTRSQHRCPWRRPDQLATVGPPTEHGGERGSRLIDAECVRADQRRGHRRFR
jgi:hypothetical protein